MKTIKPIDQITLNNPKRIVCKRSIDAQDTAFYVWDKTIIHSHEITDEPEYKSANVQMLMKQTVEIGNSCGRNGPKYFVFYVADCAFPCLYLCEGDTFEDAYDAFLDECEDMMKIEPEDLKDYTDKSGNDTYTINNNGTALDTESAQGFEVQIVRVDF